MSRSSVHDVDWISRIGRALRPAHALIVVPPFSRLIFPSLGAHLLQACARERGFDVQVLYASAVLGGMLGEDAYQRIAEETLSVMLGERFFARLAHGLPPLGQVSDGRILTLERDLGPEKAARIDVELDARLAIDLEEVRRLEAEHADAWLEAVTEAILASGYPIVGCTSMFQQTGAAVAILRRLKERRPGIVTLLGGANCEGEMAEGVVSLGAPIDHVFSGESEETFPAFLAAAVAGRRPAAQIVRGTPLTAMDTLPTPDFEDYFTQLDAFLDGRVAPERTWVMYETSRGCWWGQKQHCTFCGLNGQGMTFRRKSPRRVLAELREIGARYSIRNVMMTDNIMPFDYFKSLLPALAEEGLDLNLFYEQKANLSLEKVVALAAAGIHSIQPGIEALSTRLLRRMRKGVSAYQNLQLLRYGRAVGTYLSWNLLWGFPGDELEAYTETLELLPLLSHLQPPGALGHLVLDRFSPHFFDAEAFGIERVRPLAAYGDVFPDGADLARLAYHFVGDYDCGGYAAIDTVRALRAAVTAWQEGWAADPRPDLRIGPWDDGWALLDTRGLPGTEEVRLLDRDEAAALLVARPADGRDGEDEAVAAKVAVRLDGWLVPLAVAEPQVLLTFEREARSGRAGAQPSPQALHGEEPQHRHQHEEPPGS